MKKLEVGMMFMGLVAVVSAAEPRIQLDLGAGTSIELVFVPAGEFTQGSPDDEPGRATDELQRKTRISHDYYISRTAITRGQWARFVASVRYRTEAENGTSGGYGWDGNALVQKKQFTWRNPGFPQTDGHPVCLVTFPDAEAFCKWIGKNFHRKTTLPTEAQWEYACRAGTSTPWHAPGENAVDLIAWYKGNSGDGTRPADSKNPNAWGLVMGGNVAEWCLDWYAPYDPDAALDPLQKNKNLSDKPRRVLRGGSWLRDAKNTRSAARFRVDPRSRNADIGFRIVCAAEVMEPIVERPLGHASSAPSSEPQTEAPSGIPHHAPSGEFHHDKPKRGFSVLLGLACLLIPLALIILLIRFAVRGRTKASPFVSPVTPPLPRANPSQTIRKVADGFWIKSHVAAGTPILLNYVINGQFMEQTLIYQPGPEGQFVYTGIAPQSINVTGSGNPPPPLEQGPPSLPERNVPQEVDVIPPIFPSAY